MTTGSPVSTRFSLECYQALSLSAYIHSWVSPPSLEAHSTTPPLLSCFPILFKTQTIWAEVQAGAQKLFILNKAFGSSIPGLELGKALLEGLASTAAPQHGQSQGDRKIPASFISSHYFALTETHCYPWPHSPARMQSQHLWNAAAPATLNPQWRNQPRGSEPEQELQTFSNQHISRAVCPRLGTGNTQSVSLALGRKVKVAQGDECQSAAESQQSNKCPTSTAATRLFSPSGRFVSDLISAELDISPQNT